MPSRAKNEESVPREDLPYFIAATASGIRRQLREANIPASGLKYDLYLRLRANGLRIYNDTRHTPESSDDEYDSDEEDAGSDDDGSDEESSEAELDEPPPSSYRARKRKRKNDEGDVGDVEEVERAEEGIEELEVAGSTSLAEMPAELLINIISNLDAGGVFNLVLASPERFLAGKVDAFILEAEGRRNAANRTGLSLLEWVVLRVGREADFREAHSDVIRCVVDAYVVAFPSGSPRDRSPEARVEEIMVYLRQVGVNPVLGSAVQRGEADMVHLLILMGEEDVNQRVDNLQPLEQATVLANAANPCLLSMNRLQVVFALLAGGADTTSTRDDYPAEKNVHLLQDGLAGPGESAVDVPAASLARARVPLSGVALAAEEARLRIDPDRTWYDEPTDHPTTWPIIHNPRKLTVRQFLGDERSPFIDKAIMAFTLIITRTTRYPSFEGYHPSAPDLSANELEEDT
ncbi:hypothetical protein KVR01_010281 [Diaporthe batatas]|uniref:uncharacterized protein n=1 Tax=Diaporthe batatas TaxID=748121 RepID=UPI001D04EE34|nr:uncharacterized protein KVR01_010281 [Diaporthe batatas]KAG8159644.1 hypothetical protein KVR01_010281 [Diaporthe batatas]